MQRTEQLFNLIHEELNSIELPKGVRFRLETANTIAKMVKYDP